VGDTTPRDTLARRLATPSADDEPGLVHELVAELTLAGSGVGFIARSLDRLVELRELRGAYAVVDDDVLGPQVFTAGRRPLPTGAAAAALLAAGPGIHTDPALLDRVDELETIEQLCLIALRLDRLQYESLHDPLTGLYNRRGFDAQVLQAVSTTDRYGWSFALVVLDVDGLKAVNDRFGHHHGDAVLRAVGARLRRDLRAGDVAARIGGDEFAVLLHLGDDVDALPVLDRLRAEPLVVDETTTVTWAVGIARCPHDGSDPDTLLRLADTRLYEHKAGTAPEP
jgi:diguanylate cyclase (GGDEF)-like protein